MRFQKLLFVRDVRTSGAISSMLRDASVGWNEIPIDPYK